MADIDAMFGAKLEPISKPEVKDPEVPSEARTFPIEAKRYTPHTGDFVIGTITGSFADSYRVELNDFSWSVTLPYMAFPNASKKNRPTLSVGDLVYARVARAHRELEAELECFDPTRPHDSGSGFGLLQGGALVHVPLQYSVALLADPQPHILKCLAHHTEFEIAIGVNGKIWLKCSDLSDTLACYRAIYKCSREPQQDIKQIVDKSFQARTKD